MKNKSLAYVFIFLSLALGFSLSRIPQKDSQVKVKNIDNREYEEKGRYILKDYKGKLCLFLKGDVKPQITFKVFTDNLPDIDKLKLKEGIYAKSYSELLSLIEDYTS